MLSEQARVLAEYNAWINGKLYAVCATLPDEERKRNRGAFFGSNLRARSTLSFAF